ncbi:MAG: hypothetical protein HY051_00360 [Candidatus Aenigmarchaeota archaeon]|nr:hypothetical protein [Candidatus Aenigmarchaeota archaeon]
MQDPNLSIQHLLHGTLSSLSRKEASLHSKTQLLLEKAGERFGFPVQTLTYQGTQFHDTNRTSAFKQFCIDKGIEHIVASKTRPTTIDKTERWHLSRRTILIYENIEKDSISSSPNNHWFGVVGVGWHVSRIFSFIRNDRGTVVDRWFNSTWFWAVFICNTGSTSIYFGFNSERSAMDREGISRGQEI